MSWEVPTMTQKNSFFNWAIAKNLLKRSWVLWLAYFAILLLVLPNELRDSWKDVPGDILLSGMDAVGLSFFACPLAVMTVFSFLYSSRGSGMMSSLPVRRESLFFTVWITGLVPMLLADVLVMLISAVVLRSKGDIQGALLQWLAVAVLGNLIFYGIASFCAVLTGSLIILPIVYVVLNLTALVVAFCLSTLLGTFVYGGVGGDFWGFSIWFTPPVGICFALDAAYSRGIYPDMPSLGLLGIYAAVGLLLSAVALLLFRRRHMESATDTVAIPALKPVFKYCMTGGCALVFASFSDITRWSDALRTGMDQAMLVLSRMIIGGLIGYFAAEMLLQKSLRVFRGKWKGYLLSCCVMAALVLGIELDMFGYERYVPDPEKVESVMLESRGPLTHPENIEQVTALHRQIVSNKQRNENAKSRSDVSIVYTLKSGREVTRKFDLDVSEEARNDPDSDARRFQDLLNVQEMIDIRSAVDIPVTAATLDSLRIFDDSYETGEYDKKVEISKWQALAFYRDCLLPDIAEGHVNRAWFFRDELYESTESNITIWLCLTETYVDEDGELQQNTRRYHFDLSMDAERCLDWIRENTDLETMSRGQMYSEK